MSDKPLASYAADIEPVTYACQVQSIEQIAPTIFDVALSFDGAPHWQAGQYALLKTDQQSAPQAYSVASSAAQSQQGFLRLNIANFGDTSQAVLDSLREAQAQKRAVWVDGPMGRCFMTKAWLDNHAKAPILLVAAGTGFAQIKSFLSEILEHEDDRRVDVYWSNREQSAFYELDALTEQVANCPNIHLHLVLEKDEPSWPHQSGFLFEAIKQDFASLNEEHVFLCGSPQMVYGTFEQLEPIGLTASRAYSDVFDYAPKDGFSN